jgi:hypothetical protein
MTYAEQKVVFGALSARNGPQNGSLFGRGQNPLEASLCLLIRGEYLANLWAEFLFYPSAGNRRVRTDGRQIGKRNSFLFDHSSRAATRSLGQIPSGCKLAGPISQSGRLDAHLTPE